MKEDKYYLCIGSACLGFIITKLNYLIVPTEQLIVKNCLVVFWCNLPLHGCMQHCSDKNNQKQRRGAMSKGHEM
ncbi:hypothetical protein BDQ94DRAFT_151637 [Aspergillus welwitschiae]|uniref:Uncharacterized protein n=1 Tax=Aspergillus welwitschiae TaxID=1341132 RepID=A0A3F3PPG8_9EURO|nr:hypothetical protein BDQ94DRAFT_151637 [Aspergillus welwitschiae]RDH28825.1 hypothetical protein BDQ94DRAFT_151637 [Aspergillus welwitschiae]